MMKWWWRHQKEQLFVQAFNVGENEVKELMPGQALIVDEKGELKIEQISRTKRKKSLQL